MSLLVLLNSAKKRLHHMRTPHKSVAFIIPYFGAQLKENKPEFITPACFSLFRFVTRDVPAI